MSHPTPSKRSRRASTDAPADAPRKRAKSGKPAKDAPKDRGGTTLNPYSLDADGWCEPSQTRAELYMRDGPPADPRAAFVMRETSTRMALARSLETLSNEEPRPIDFDIIALRFLTHPDKERVAKLFPLPPKSRRALLEQEIAAVRVRKTNGETMPLDAKVREARALTKAEAERIVEVLVHLRHAWTSRFAAPGAGDSGYDDVNWRHACAEVGQILDVAAESGLSARVTEDAVLASLFSDAAKLRDNFLTHHVDGAIAAAAVLPRFLELEDDEGRKRLAGICQTILEHQVGPPRFMAAMVRMGVEQQLRKAGGTLRPDEREVLHGLQLKIADPLNPQHVRFHVEGYGVLAVDLREQAMLEKIGLAAWWVPHPATPWFAASSAIIDADSLVNYVTPDGVGKIVAITGPGTPFHDPTVFHSIFSCGASFIDAVSVMSDTAMSAVKEGVRRTRGVIEQVRARVSLEIDEGWLHFKRDDFERIVSEEQVDTGKLRAVEREGEILVDTPWLDGGELPYWNCPLDYEADGAPLEFAKLLRRKVADMLRET